MPGSSASLLSSLRRIETPDDRDRPLPAQPARHPVRLGPGLARPPRSSTRRSTTPTGSATRRTPSSAPARSRSSSLTADELRLARYEDYVGRTPARLAELVYRTVADSATIEDAMTKGTVEVVWRGLDAAAITRLQQQVEQARSEQTESGYAPTVLTGVRVLQLQWSPESRGRGASKPLRTAIALALQGDRTSASLVPAGVAGHVASFPLGGKATPKVTWKSRINLTLGYDPTTPNGRDLADPDPDPAGGHRRAQRQARARRGRGRPAAAGPQGVDGHRPGLAAALPGRAAARGRRRR